VNLEARFNQLQTLDAGFRPGLGYLGVSSNGLTSLSTLNGANTPWLYMIDVSFNQLTSLQGVEAAPSLSAIAARGNQLASLADLAGNPRLDWLDVSSNQLTSFDDLPPNPPLAWLNASRNQIASLSGLAVAANLYLTRLDVSRNLLASVAEIASADRLYNLDIADNQVSDLAPLQGRMWQELGLANNPTGDVQSVLFQGNGMPGVVSVGPGQLPNLTVCSEKLFGTWMFSANGPEYGNLNGLRWFRFKQLRVSGAGISSLTALADAAAIYGSSVSRLALPGNMFSDLSPLGGVPMTWLDVSENAVEDISSVTSEHLASQFNPPTHGLQLLNLSANPVESLAPALGQTMYQEHFPPIGAIIFAEYELEQFGMTPEQAHNCLTFDAVVDVTDTPVAAAPEVGQLRAEGVKVRTEGTCSYCAGACVPPVQVAAPEVTGLTQEAAAAALEAARLTVGTVTLQCSDAVAAGLVISQDPAVGTIMDEGSGVALVVSLGPCTVPVTVPDVVGQPVSEAVATVQAAGLLIGTLTQSHSDTVPAGSVVRQNPAAGASVPPDTAVALVISLGASPAEGEGEPQVPLEERAQALLDGFCAADSDGNRHLSLAEAQAAQPGLTEDEFALLDANGDGELSKHELDEYLEGPCGCRGCHGGAPEWDRRLGEFSLLFLAMIGFGVIGQAARP
jgi:Leucine-rich repeat (LRR) protein